MCGDMVLIASAQIHSNHKCTVYLFDFSKIIILIQPAMLKGF